MKSKNYLAGLTVLVTRPRPQGEALCALIQEAGGQAVYFPTIEIQPPENPAQFAEHIKKLDEFDYLLFVSPQAVLHSLTLIKPHWPTLPPTLKIAAVGESTAKTLRGHGLSVDFFPKDEWSSEGLLKLEEFHTVGGKKIGLVKGEGGREVLEETLASRGATVTPFIAYRRGLPVVDSAPYAKLFREHKINVIVAASFESLTNLKKLLGSDHWAELSLVPVIVNSARLKALAEESGFKTLLLARNASHNAIIETLSQEKESLCRTEQKNR